jgi:hypothetical protein
LRRKLSAALKTVGVLKSRSFPVEARRAGQVVVAAVGQSMAGGAGQDVAAREPDVVEQLLPEPHLVGIEGDAARKRRDRLPAGGDRGGIA